MILMNQMMACCGVEPGASSDLTVSVTDSGVQTGVGDPQSTSFSVTLDADSPGRTIYVASVFLSEAVSRIVSAVGVGGVALDEIYYTAQEAVGPGWTLQAYIHKGVVSGTSGQITFNTDYNKVIGPMFAVFSVSDENGVYEHDKGSNQETVALSAPSSSGGFAVACAMTQNGTEISWSGATELIGGDANTDEWASIAWVPSTSAGTVDVDCISAILPGAKLATLFSVS